MDGSLMGELMWLLINIWSKLHHVLLMRLQFSLGVCFPEIGKISQAHTWCIENKVYTLKPTHAIDSILSGTHSQMCISYLGFFLLQARLLTQVGPVRVLNAPACRSASLKHTVTRGQSGLEHICLIKRKKSSKKFSLASVFQSYFTKHEFCETKWLWEWE